MSIDLTPLTDQQVVARQRRYNEAWQRARDQHYYFMQNEAQRRAWRADDRRHKYQDEFERCSAELGRRHRERGGRVSFVVAAW